MAELTFIIGGTGTGKTSSLRNLKGSEVGYITPTGKKIPRRRDIIQFHAKNYAELIAAIKQSKFGVMVIDDFNYFMTNEEFARSKEVGYGKFTDMAVNFVNVLNLITSKDTTQRFYIMAHPADTEDGRLRIKTVGKMVSDKFVPEGLVNQVIETIVENDGDEPQFLFRVKTDGRGVKTPLGMFDTATIPNDLKIVDNKIKEFYK